VTVLLWEPTDSRPPHSTSPSTVIGHNETATSFLLCPLLCALPPSQQRDVTQITIVIGWWNVWVERSAVCFQTVVRDNMWFPCMSFSKRTSRNKVVCFIERRFKQLIDHSYIISWKRCGRKWSWLSLCLWGICHRFLCNYLYIVFFLS